MAAPVSAISLILATAALLLAFIVVLFVIEVVVGLTVRRRDDANSHPAPRLPVAVLIPAYDESSGLLPTLQDVSAQMCSGDRIIVVADNCSDDTAAIAAAAGAEVVERKDAAKRGKGYALAFGRDRLAESPPSIVIIVDADCRVEEHAIDCLARTCLATGRPVQALDLMVCADASPPDLRVAEFAWRIKNWIRPLGLKALGFPCQLMGTGMAFPWAIIRDAQLATGNIVEDLKLGLDLARAGYAATFCPSARVTSAFPASDHGVQSQRARWEKGHIALIATAAPSLMLSGMLRRDPQLVMQALDLAIPPLTLLASLLVYVLTITSLAALFGLPRFPLYITATAFFLFVLALFLAWQSIGRDLLPMGQLRHVIGYFLKKIPLYRRMLTGRGSSQWIRTDRSSH